jgi:hypothetical protein
MTQTDLPRCHDRMCRNRARYQVAPGIDSDTGKPLPEVPMCGTHRNVQAPETARALQRFEYRQRAAAADVLREQLHDAFQREAGLDIDFTHGPGARYVQLPIADARRLLEWLS